MKVTGDSEKFSLSLESSETNISLRFLKSSYKKVSFAETDFRKYFKVVFIEY